MRKLFLKFSMLFFALTMGVSASRAGISIGEPSDWYYVNFVVGVSTPACGTTIPGQVKLTYTDIDHQVDNLQICEPEPQVPEEYANYEWAWDGGYAKGKEYAEDPNNATYEDGIDDYKDYENIDEEDFWGWSDGTPRDAYVVSEAGYKAGFDWVKSSPCKYLNTTNPTDWGTSASLNGYAMIHMDGMDLNQMSSYAYFEAKARENDGWYFAGWSFTEGDTDLGGHVDTDTEEDKGYLFKIFPSDLQGLSNKSQTYAYATFKPVRVSDYKVNGLINGTGNSTTVVFDVVGERVSAEDFTVSCPEANFTAEISSCDANKVTVTVTYSGAANGEFRGNVTLASKSGCSQLTAAVYARGGATSDKEASLYNGKVLEENLVESGDLTALIAKATATQIVALNNNYEKTLTVNSNATIFTNGYRITTLNVEGGLITIAYDKYDGGADAISVTGGKLVLNGGIFGALTIGVNGEVEQNGATFTGAANNNGKLTTNEGVFNGGLTSTQTLIINNGTFNGATAVTVSGGTADIKRGVIEGTTYGLKVAAGGSAIVKKLAAIKGATNSILNEGGTVNVECGKFDGLLSTVTSFISGYFKEKAHAVNVKAGKEWMQLTDGVEYNEGYRFYLGNSETALNNGVGVCSIGDVSYARLEDALAYANNNPSVENIIIFMTNDYTLPAGYYTLPANATLVVPMSDTQKKTNPTAPRLVYNDVNNADADKYSNNIPFEFRSLTFSNGVNMDVFGKIELTCTQYASNEAYTSQPVGAYGHLVMEDGSHMTLQNGSELRAWGFMTGNGETDARRGATVREMFQMGDWKGAMTSVLITGMVAGTPIESIVQNAIVHSESGDYSDKKIFPVSQYFIQNVESPVKYHPGALLSTSAAVSEGVMGMSISMAATDIAVVGVSGEHTAIFLMDIAADAENTWVRKWYDAEHDIQVYDINSGAHIGSMELDMGGVSLGGASIPVRLNSAMFDLPITSNFKIHLLTGNMDFEQNTALLPGSEVEVDKESTVSISMNAEDKAAKVAGTANHVYHSGAVFVYDQADWDTYAYNNKYTKVVRYAPSALNGKGGQPNKRAEGSCPASAKINVHGTFNTKDGYVYTSAGGADIVSSDEDAGSFIFNSPATDAGSREVYQIKGKGTNDNNYQSKTFTTAQLKNSNDSYTNTQSAILGGLTFVYRDGAWQEPMTQTENDVIVTYNSNCYTADVSMMSYVGMAYNVTDNSSQNAILASPLKDNVLIYYAPDNIAEFLVAKPIAAQLAPGEEMTAQGYEWMKQSDDIWNYGMTYKQAFASYKSQILEGVENVKSAGCDFGSAVQKIYIKPQEWVEINGTAHMELAIDDVSYFEELYDEGVTNQDYSLCTQAVEEYLDYMEANKMNLIIDGVDGNADHTYSDADGAGRLFIKMDNCQWWEVEKKDNLYHCIHPNNDTYYEWGENPETLEEGWMEKSFTITWKNWNGDIVKTANEDGVLQDSYKVPYGTIAEFLGTNPTREATIDYTYDFTGWSPALGKVTSDVTYTATYDTKPRMYTIIFQNEGGVEIERQFLTHNEWPVCENTPTKIGHTLEWTPALAAVTGGATYTATFVEDPPTEYEITFFDYNGTKELQKGNVNVGDMPEYIGATPTGKATWAEEQGNKEYTYVFDHWSPAPEEVSATSAKSYTAIYREVAATYTVIFLNEDNSEIERHEYAYGETPVCSATPSKDATPQYSYTFAWTPQIETVRESKTYKAVFTPVTNRYTVTLKANPSGACTFTGAGTFDYGTAVSISRTDNEGYTFNGWTDAEGNTVSVLPTTITADINLVANFTVADSDYTITWKNESGSDNLVAPVGQKAGTATTYTGATPTKAPTASKTFTFYGWSTAANGGGTIYKNGLTPKATANATYYAYFNETARKYTISWKNEAGTADIELDLDQPYGAKIAFNSATPTKKADAYATYTFDGWSSTQGGDVVAVPATVTGDANFYAHFAATPVVVEDNDIVIGVNGTEDLEDAVIGKDNLIITSNGVTSGQLLGANNLTLTGEAVFRLEKSFAAETWYAVAVPWAVNINSGIYAGGKRLKVGDIFVIEFDANAYASADRESRNYWIYLDETGNDMQPGKLYMIWFKSAQTAVEFHKTSGGILNTSVTLSPAEGSIAAQTHWNAIANPALFHANLATGADSDDVLKYNGDDTYVLGNTTNMIVGEPMFAQVNSSSSITATYAGGSGMPAYRRAPQTKADNRFVLELTNDNRLADRMIVQTAEEKANEYVIGKDLSKMGLSSKVAQMWIDRYDAKLCKNTVELIGEQVEYPLNISAPAAGEYVLSASQERGAATLYLTRNGKAIWNLSNSAFVLNLEQGTTGEYGLRLYAPQVTTDIDEAIVDAQGDTRKVLLNNQVFIIRDNKVYTVDGRMVK